MNAMCKGLDDYDSSNQEIPSLRQQLKHFKEALKFIQATCYDDDIKEFASGMLSRYES